MDEMVYVVMYEDFPLCVYRTLDAAKADCVADVSGEDAWSHFEWLHFDTLWILASGERYTQYKIRVAALVGPSVGELAEQRHQVLDLDTDSACCDYMDAACVSYVQRL